jgi:hypothetical protein
MKRRQLSLQTGRQFETFVCILESGDESVNVASGVFLRCWALSVVRVYLLVLVAPFFHTRCDVYEIIIQSYILFSKSEKLGRLRHKMGQ